jgi:hypothetical protein
MVMAGSLPAHAQETSVTEQDREAAHRDADSAISQISSGFESIWADAGRTGLKLELEPVDLAFLGKPQRPWAATGEDEVRWGYTPPEVEGLAAPSQTAPDWLQRS